MSTPEIVADRERIRRICELPEARSQLRTALNMALDGANANDARIALQITAGAMSADEVAETINARTRGR